MLQKNTTEQRRGKDENYNELVGIGITEKVTGEYRSEGNEEVSPVDIEG